MSAIISRKKPLLAALFAVLLWAFAFPASKAVFPYFSVEQLMLLRHLVACAFYWTLFSMGYFRLPKWRDLPSLFLLGVLGITIYQLLFLHGLERVAAGAASMIITTNPVFASLLARFFLHEKLPTIAWCGICISLGGVAMIAFSKGTGGEFIGYLMLVIAVLSISIYFVFQKPFFTRYSPLSMTAYTTIAGTLPLLYLLPQTTAAALQAPADALMYVVIMGIFSSGVGFLLLFYALSKLPTGVVTSFLFLQPIFVIIMAWLWLHEIPETVVFGGGGIILIGVVLILLPRKPESQETQ